MPKYCRPYLCRSFVILCLFCSSGLADEATVLEVLKTYDVRFKVDGNNLAAPVVEIALTGPKVTDEVLKHIPEFTSLRRLDLSKSVITDAALQELKACHQLQHLDLSGTKVTGTGLAELQPLRDLKSLCVTLDPMTDAGFQTLTHHKQLEKLSIEGRLPRHLSLAAVRDMDQLENLKTLRVSDALFYGKALASLKRLKSLESLTWQFVDELDEEDWAEIQQCTKLRILSITHGRFRNSALPGLKNLKNLISLTLFKMNVSDAAAKEIGELTELKQLSLNGSAVTDAALKELKGLTKLRMIQLQATDVTDDGVQELRRALPQMKVLR